MMIQVLRPMHKGADGRPELGEAALRLGVRSTDVQLNDDCKVMPTQGVSIATSMQGVRKLPPFLLPFKFSKLPLKLDPHKSNLKLFAYSATEFEPFRLRAPIGQGLSVVAKSTPGTGYIVPIDCISIEDFNSLVINTRGKWQDIGWQVVIQLFEEMDDD